METIPRFDVNHPGSRAGMANQSRSYVADVTVKKPAVVDEIPVAVGEGQARAATGTSAMRTPQEAHSECHGNSGEERFQQHRLLLSSSLQRVAAMNFVVHSPFLFNLR